VSFSRVQCERAMLAVLDGSCRTPIAGYAEVNEAGELVFRASLLSVDGSVRLDASGTAPLAEACVLGERVGHELKARAGADMLSFSV
jgi:hydroxymethylbilane synthase